MTMAAFFTTPTARSLGIGRRELGCTLRLLNIHDDLPRQPDAQSPLEYTTQGPHPKSPPRPFTKGNRQRPSPKHPSTKRGPPTPQKSPAPQASRQHAQRETPDHHKKQREGTTAPPETYAPLTPRTTQTHSHTEPPQQPIDEPQQQLTQHNTTTTDTQHSTPSDRDENMTEENPAAFQGRRFDPHPELTIPKPDNWHEMSASARKNWSRRRNGKV